METEKKIIKSFKDIEKLVELSKKHKIDLLEVEGIKIVMSTFPNETKEFPEIISTSSEEQDEADLYWSNE